MKYRLQKFIVEPLLSNWSKLFDFFSDGVALQKLITVRSLQINKVILDNEKQKKAFELFKNEMNIDSFCFFFTLASVLCPPSRDVINFSDCWFQKIFETEKFLHLDVNTVKKILVRFGLFITSELEVLTAVEKWISYNFEERSSVESTTAVAARQCLKKQFKTEENHLLESVVTA